MWSPRASRRARVRYYKMPKKQHIPSVSDKEQRMYEHIKESELQRGRSTRSAKGIAAATVIKHHNENRHPRGK
jgi:hypothetical protein